MAVNPQIDGLELADLNTPEDAADEEVARVGLGWLETQRDVLRSRLVAEREAGVPSLADLEKQLGRAQKSLEKLETKQKKAKRTAKLRKQEIAEWKQWYEGVAAVERDRERETLAAEIGWRSEAIVAQEAKVLVQGLPLVGEELRHRTAGHVHAEHCREHGAERQQEGAELADERGAHRNFPSSTSP